MKDLRLLAGLAGVAIAFYGVRKRLKHDADEWSAQEPRSARAFRHVS